MRHRKPSAHHQRVIQRSQTNRALSDRKLQDTVRIIEGAFLSAEQRVTPVVAQFVTAYRDEWDRVSADLADEETGDVDVAQRAAQLRHWLIVSGWRTRLMAAYRTAAHDASQESLDAILAAQKPMLETGWNHARQLVIAAMQPAITAGAPWRPKP